MRKLMRSTLTQGVLLGLEGTMWLSNLWLMVPEITAVPADRILSAESFLECIVPEQQRFNATLSRGEQLLHRWLDDKSKSTITGEQVLHLEKIVKI